MKMKKLLILLPLTIIVAILGGGFYIYNNILNTETIYSGVKVENIDVSNMTKTDAYNFLKTKKEAEPLEKSMRLLYEEIEFGISLEQLGFKYDYDKAIDEAYELGREGDYLTRFKKIQNLKKHSETIALEYDFDLGDVKDIVEDISQKINIDSKDAEFDFNAGNIRIKDEIIGRALDKDKLIGLIEANIEEFKDINMPVNVDKPKYTREFYSQINGVIGEFSTSFKGSSYGRIENIKLSAKALSNKLLLPGEQLSYNETTGPRQKSSGYLDAPVIVAGDLTPGVGGGVCQTSTTLYNALLLADMKILKRSPHSLTPSYVPKGQDAAVATGYLDLVFQNDFDFPVYTLSKVVGDRLYFYIYGDTIKKDYTVKIDSELLQKIDYNIIENLDEAIAPGVKQLVQDGRTGYKVKTYKTIIKDGKTIERVPITTDYYRERNYIYNVGPKPIAGEFSNIDNNNGNGNSDDTIILDPLVDDPIDRP